MSNVEKFENCRSSKKGNRKLQKFVGLAESFKPSTLEEQIIKEYAYMGSIEKVAIKINELGYMNSDGHPFEKDDISKVIKGKPTNDLHKLIRSGFLKKTRHTRRKIGKYRW